MRNNLSELPVLLSCLWSGAMAGSVVFLLALPKLLWRRKNRGRRLPFGTRLIFALLDILICAAAGVIFSAALISANGGELRLYAVAGFFIALAFVLRLLKTAAGLAD